MEKRKESCGGCDYRGEVTQNEVECLVDDQWYKKGHWCPRWKKYVQGRNKDERLKLAIEKRREEGAEAAEKRMRDFKKEIQEDNKRFQTKLVILAGLIAFLTSLITNLIFP